MGNMVVCVNGKLGVYILGCVLMVWSTADVTLEFCILSQDAFGDLGFVSKMLERVVSERLEAYLCTNSLHDVHQSTYMRFINGDCIA